MDAKELRNLAKEELIAKEKFLKDDLAKLNQERYSGRVDKPHRFALIKKDIARIRTVIREKEKNPNG